MKFQTAQAKRDRERDEAEVKLHLQITEMAITGGSLRRAVEEILKAHETLEKSSNASASWGGPYRITLDGMAKRVAVKLSKQAKELSNKRQYKQAREKVALGQKLPSKNEKLSELLERINTLEADSKTANISGTWEGPNGIYTLIDDGTDIIRCDAVKLPDRVSSCVGKWTRKGDKLEGKFPRPI